MTKDDTMRVEVEPGVFADVPVGVLSKVIAEAELKVTRERLLDDLTAIGDPGADARLEAGWERATGHARAADLIRSDDAALMRAWNEHEDRQRARLRLPPRQDS